ncbi:hypothetical protein ES705_08955 [subsurface metagenome]
MLRFVLTPIKVELSKKGDHIFEGSSPNISNPTKKAIILSGRIRKIVMCCNFLYFRIKTVNIINIIVIVVTNQSLCAKAPTKRSKIIKSVVLNLLIFLLSLFNTFKFIFKRTIMTIVIIILVLTVIVVS